MLNAFSDIEAQRIQSVHVQKSKQEIKESLDSVNLGFEKFFNSLFTGVTIDISSEISVLNTMLSNDGLQQNDFDHDE